MSGHSSALVEGGILSGMIVMLTLLGIYIPIILVFVMIFQAFPILVLVVRHGVKPGIIASFATLVLISILGGPLAGLYFMGTVPVAIILGWSLKERKMPVLGLTLASVAGFLAKLAIIGINLKFLGINYFTMMESSINATSAATIETFKAMGTDQEQLAVMSQGVEQTIPVLLVLMPALIIATAVFEAYINLWLAGVFLPKIGQTAVGCPPFEQWDFPKSSFYGWALSFAAWNAGLYYFGAQALTYKFSLNVFALFTIVLFLQGFAVVSFFLKKLKIPLILRIGARALILIFIMVTPIIFFSVIYAGVADIFANFRRLQRGE